MNQILRAILIALTLTAIATPALAAKAKTVFVTTCKTSNIGTDRWAEKVDISTPPANPPAKTVADLIAWKGPGGDIAETGDGEERVAKEQEFYQVTGKVYTILLESDGDVHIKLVDPADKHPTSEGVHFIDVEIPPAEMTGKTKKAKAYNESVKGNPWCALRTTVLGWTNFKSKSKYGTKLKVNEHPVITVTGLAFYDIDHREGDNLSNVRVTSDHHTDVWEIHPVMDLQLAQQ